MLNIVKRMYLVRFYHIFNTSEIRRDRKNLIADLDSAPESYLNTLSRLPHTKFLWHSVTNSAK